MSQTIHSTDIVDIRKGTTQALKAYKGSTVIWTAPAVLHSMKCTKTGGTQTVLQNVLTVVTPWIADGAYPNTVLATSSTGLKADGDGLWDITVQMTWVTSAGAGTNRRINLLKNGVQYGSTFNPTATSTVVVNTWNDVPVSTNDVITAQTFTANSTTANRQIVASTSTYILAVV